MPNPFDQSKFEDETRKEMIMPIPPRKTTTPKADEAELAEMGLSPIVKAEIIPAKQQNQSPAIAKENSISELLADAYKRSSQIPITPQESEALLADFHDADFVRGAGGDNNLLYLDQSALRQRFNKVLGVGQWSVITVRSWSEDYKTAKGQDASRVYCEAVLLVRGCVAGSAIGSMDYFKGNAAQNYGDAFEGSKTAALRRCAKEFGVGLQCYSKEWCEQWKAKYPGFERPKR